MPIIHKYAGRSGFYVKTAFKRKIVTYQLTSAGEEYVKHRKYRDGQEISTKELLWMQKKGYVYTRGSGPGELPRESSPKGMSTFAKDTHRQQKKKGCSGCFLTLLALFTLSGALTIIVMV